MGYKNEEETGPQKGCCSPGALKVHLGQHQERMKAHFSHWQQPQGAVGDFFVVVVLVTCFGRKCGICEVLLLTSG